MKIYSFKSIARRGSLLGAAFALAASTLTPFAPAAFADALNPLTERSLTLSSSAPGWDYLDGSGNTTYDMHHQILVQMVKKSVTTLTSR